MPDRIPCLKVRFSLPNWTPGAGGRNQPSPDPSSQALRKVSSLHFLLVALSSFRNILYHFGTLFDNCLAPGV